LRADVHWKLKTEQCTFFHPLWGCVLALMVHAGIVACLLMQDRPTDFASTAHDVAVQMIYEAAVPPAAQRARALSAPATPLLPQAKPRLRSSASAPRHIQAERQSPLAVQTPKSAAAPAATISTPASQGADALEQYARKVWGLIEKAKPVDNAVPGRLLVKIVIAPDGTLVSEVIVQGSGDDELDQHALAAVDDAAPFPPPPGGATLSQRTFIVPFNFQ
jgi:protein TonB